MKQSIIIFDGVCNFCNKSINFIIKRDQKSNFLFTPIQNESAQELMKKHNINNKSIDTLILIKGEKCFLRSDAVFEIIKELSGYWYLFGVFRIVPLSMRDYCYNFISNNRYKFFGKKDSCMIPTTELQKRFLF